MFLSDLTFIEDGNPNIIDGLINFRKRLRVHDVLKKIDVLQNTPYNLTPVVQIKDYIKTFPVMKETEVYEQSLLREPRDADVTQIE